jgi:MYXO-CTERM domain-containing protein
MLRKAFFVLALGALVSSTTPAGAAFHLWQIKEVYSNADGSVQYIELFTIYGSQNFVNGHQITATSDAVVKTFTFTSDTPGDTTNKHLILATPAFASLPGAVTPDYILPCGPFFDPSATSITINFPGADVLTFAGSSVPVNGSSSLTDTNLFNTANLVAGASSPTNFTGTVGAMNLTGCLQAGTCEPCDDGLFCNGAESCAASMCVAGQPCMDICDEVNDTCFECTNVSHCNDQNVCTDDACVNNTCVNSNNTVACNDGLFCTATDACSGGACVGTGDACNGQNCNEGTDTCGDCMTDPDCEDGDPCILNTCELGDCMTANAPDATPCADDGEFCTGVEGCVAGVCASPGDPCSAMEVCDDQADECVALCGNGMKDPGEACDDGNVQFGDGCSTTCTVEPGFTCDDTEPSVCTPTGDGGASSSGPTTGAGGAPAVPPTAEEDDGCGCRAAGGAPTKFAALLLTLGAAWALRRRRVRPS